jgi:hypothetical protein
MGWDGWGGLAALVSCLCTQLWGDCYKWLLSLLNGMNGTLHTRQRGILLRCKHLPQRRIHPD